MEIVIMVILLGHNDERRGRLLPTSGPSLRDIDPTPRLFDPTPRIEESVDQSFSSTTPFQPIPAEEPARPRINWHTSSGLRPVIDSPTNDEYNK